MESGSRKGKPSAVTIWEQGDGDRKLKALPPTQISEGPKVNQQSENKVHCWSDSVL